MERVHSTQQDGWYFDPTQKVEVYSVYYYPGGGSDYWCLDSNHQGRVYDDVCNPSKPNQFQQWNIYPAPPGK